MNVKKNDIISETDAALGQAAEELQAIQFRIFKRR